MSENNENVGFKIADVQVKGLDEIPELLVNIRKASFELKKSLEKLENHKVYVHIKPAAEERKIEISLQVDGKQLAKVKKSAPEGQAQKQSEKTFKIDDIAKLSNPKITDYVLACVKGMNNLEKEIEGYTEKNIKMQGKVHQPCNLWLKPTEFNNYEKHVISKDVEEKFISKIIEFAKEEGLTTNNIKESMDKVYLYMSKNATV